MEKFNDFLNNKIKTEDEKFIVPDKVNNRIEDTLRNLDILVKEEHEEENVENTKKFDFNKKYISIAAMFILVFGIGIRVMNPVINQESENTNKNNSLRDGSAINEVMEFREGNLKKISNGDRFIDLNDVRNIEIRSLKDDIYISTVAENEINLVLNYINSLYLNSTNDRTIDSYEYLIKLSGKKEIEIIIQNNLISIDGQIYICDYNLQEQFKVIFEQL